MTNLKTMAAAAALAFAAVAGAAKADVYDFGYSAIDPNVFTTAFGSFTTNSSGLITSISGEAIGPQAGAKVYGGDITGLAALGSYGGNDNLYLSSTPHFDGDGLSFDAGGIVYNLFVSGSTYYVNNSHAKPTGFGSNPAATPVTFTVTDISAVPEPTIWTMMLAGVAMMGAALRFNRRRGSAIASA